MAKDDHIENPIPQLDERAIGRKYGVRELVYPDPEQINALKLFLSNALETGRCGPLPKTAVLVLLDFLQATANRQHITKSPGMAQSEFDLLQAPYYTLARIVSRVQRARQESLQGRLYETTWLSINQFLELLRNLIDPGCYWMRLKAVPEGVRESMSGLLEFLEAFSELRRKDRGL